MPGFPAALLYQDMARFCFTRLCNKKIELLSHYLRVSNTITLHYRDNEAVDRPSLLLLHALSDNTHAFDAVIDAGLGQSFRVIAPDLRGRGASSRPHTGYSLREHCTDILAILDDLRLERVHIAGHSFGGLLGLYFAAHHPERVLGLTMIDAAAELNPLTPFFLLMAARRLGKWYRSESAYVMSLRCAPFMTHWDESMRRMFVADTLELPDGSLMVKTQKLHIMQCSAAASGISKEQWRQYARAFTGPALLLTASDSFLQGQHILPRQKAIETAVLLPDGTLEKIPGNHMTMLFGAGAVQIAARIKERFLTLANSCN